ncbi:MAG: hypothetical protein GTO53_04720 [Planctomycetales bacterium]|nr:hypothetical protein [Planctomycetales bacterium]NIM08458.1 hypothetical protein [Planctomycetales bacterium]NIP68862.1 hypothetical protein [Planctomycetales bacterium]
MEGFSKQIRRTPAAMALSSLPAGYGFAFECRVEDTTEHASKPLLDRVTLFFESAPTQKRAKNPAADGDGNG